MTTKTKTTREANKPTYYAYHVTDAKAEGQKARWNRIGDGGTLVLDLLPIGFNGRVVLRAPKVEGGA